MSDTSQTVTNRSEIVFLYDAVDANPNGNPLSGSNRPRIDPETQQCIVTDVRLKRYLRDQLDADGHGVYIRSVQTNDGDRYSREQLLADRLRDLDPNDWDLNDLSEEDEQDLFDEVYGTFLDHSVDVRYFGATMSVDLKGKYEDFDDYLPDHLQGPVQFSPGKSMHSVEENQEYNSLTSVIATGKGKEQGGFDLDDHRIKYALIRFRGLVDEHGAKDTQLTKSDIERLDTLCWRALKNQTTSRSKIGQEPRLYIRVEYADESFHLGDLSHKIQVDKERSEPDEQLRTIQDIVVDIEPFIECLSDNASRIDTIHVVGSPSLQLSHDSDIIGIETLYTELEDTLGADKVHRINVHNEFKTTLPDTDD
ncbi:type I-B CRISPR-associated protein Cas7/Csh2 [Halorubrum laminariae]|uniref:Type I-B CRISPR-associated protein Cas7/Csh2 n=1 Tax=Halorubrum laminariae TaxID=1433523 RepID=A0ABD6C3L6_9EURY|nr:type I-B CRISPR-associated protein Cas7/Csh2 [Halorubrum laminariae]